MRPCSSTSTCGARKPRAPPTPCASTRCAPRAAGTPRCCSCSSCRYRPCRPRPRAATCASTPPRAPSTAPCSSPYPAPAPRCRAAWGRAPARARHACSSTRRSARATGWPPCPAWARCCPAHACKARPAWTRAGAAAGKACSASCTAPAWSPRRPKQAPQAPSRCRLNWPPHSSRWPSLPAPARAPSTCSCSTCAPSSRARCPNYRAAWMAAYAAAPCSCSCTPAPRAGTRAPAPGTCSWANSRPRHATATGPAPGPCNWPSRWR